MPLILTRIPPVWAGVYPSSLWAGVNCSAVMDPNTSGEHCNSTQDWSRQSVIFEIDIQTTRPQCCLSFIYYCTTYALSRHQAYRKQHCFDKKRLPRQRDQIKRALRVPSGCEPKQTTASLACSSMKASKHQWSPCFRSGLLLTVIWFQKKTGLESPVARIVRP